MGIKSGVCEWCNREFTFDRRSGLRRFCGRLCSTAFTGQQRKTPEPERFDRHVTKSHPSGCWEWTGPRSPKGYGLFRDDTGRMVSAHRHAYFRSGKVMPEGHLCCHSCDNPSCVNPDHLFPGTPKQNTQDMVRKGRNHTGDKHYLRQSPEKVRGERNPCSRLTEADVRAIRSLAGKKTHAEIAAMYGVSPAAVSHVINRRNWKHVV